MDPEHPPHTQLIAPSSSATMQVPAPNSPASPSKQALPAQSELFRPATMGLLSLGEDLVDVAVSQAEDKALLRRFVSAAEARAQAQGIADAWSVADIAADAEIELNTINRDSALNIAMWVAWLQVTARFLPQDALKYQTREAFMENYPVFQEYDVAEQEKLWHTANWMSYLFTQIPAKKNKGLSIQITPKLVEGWHARYVTGSGQTKQTADRVHVYEVEGDIQPYQKVKTNKRKRPAKKVESKPKKSALGAEETSLPRMEGVEYDEGEGYPTLAFDALEADHTLADSHHYHATAPSGVASSNSSPAVSVHSAPAPTGSTTFDPFFSLPPAASSNLFYPAPASSPYGSLPLNVGTHHDDFSKGAEHSPAVTQQQQPQPAPMATFDTATKYHPGVVSQQYMQQQQLLPQQQQQQRPRESRRRRLPSYDNDTSSESMDGDLESLTSPAASMDHSFAGPDHMPEPQLGPELIPLARLGSWNPADNPPVPNGQPPMMANLQTPSPRLVRLCSWGTTQPEPQIGDHRRSLQDLPAFPAARPNGYGYGSHAGNELFSNDLGDGMDPLELFLNGNFELDETL